MSDNPVLTREELFCNCDAREDRTMHHPPCPLAYGQSKCDCKSPRCLWCDREVDCVRDLRAALDKAEAEVERLTKEPPITTVTYGCTECAQAHGRTVLAYKARDKAEAALRELHGRLQLCHGAIMGYGCSAPFHNPKCATTAVLDAEGEEKAR